MVDAKKEFTDLDVEATRFDHVDVNDGNAVLPTSVTEEGQSRHRWEGRFDEIEIPEPETFGEYEIETQYFGERNDGDNYHPISFYPLDDQLQRTLYTFPDRGKYLYCKADKLDQSQFSDLYPKTIGDLRFFIKNMFGYFIEEGQLRFASHHPNLYIKSPDDINLFTYKTKRLEILAHTYQDSRQCEIKIRGEFDAIRFILSHLDDQLKRLNGLLSSKYPFYKQAIFERIQGLMGRIEE